MSPDDQSNHWNVLMLEDNEDDALLIINHLETHGCDISWTRIETEPDLRKHLANDEWDVVLSDYSMPLFDGVSALRVVRELDPDMPFVFVSGTLGEKAAVAAIKGGAQDYVVKHDLNRLAPVVERAIADQALQKRHRLAQDVLRKLSQAVEQAADSIFITNRQGEFEYVNPAFEKMTGYRAEAVAGRTPSVLKATQQNPAAYSELWETVLGKQTYRGTLVNRKHDGATFYEEKVITPLVNQAGQITHFVSTGRDISDRVKADEDRARLNAILEATTDIVAIADATGAVIYVNKAGHSLLAEIKPDSSATQAAGELIGNALGQAEKHGVWERESVLSGGDGQTIYLHQVIMSHRDQNGNIAYFSTIARNISERKQFEAELQHQATHDVLTGLANRVLLAEQLQTEMNRSQRRNSVTAVVFLDMDNFKRVNDSLGHGIGDQLLQQVSVRLGRHIRPNDILARYGGDEFVIVASDLENADAITAILDKLNRAFEHPVHVARQDIFVSFSAGIAVYPDDGGDADTLLRNADSAMYQSKADGGRAFRFYAPAMNERQQRLLAMESELHRALARNEFVVYYQPQAELASGQVTGAEALIRWRHPQRGLVPPDEFIPLLEETGLINEVGLWVLRRACLDMTTYTQTHGLCPRVSVNLSARQFASGELVQQVAQVLEETGFPPDRLELEITEQILISDLQASKAILGALHDMGVSVAIDDFGTGYCSLAYLKRLPLHVLKIDRTFVAGLPADHNDLAIVEAIILLAHKLDLQVVAEGVETLGQLETLRSLGCDMVQGYYLGKPAPLQALAETGALAH
ncbi:EAL domain-containing protein [Pseudomonas sp.]|uniref:EAL domain-containing protein n=1 Tax=Pseudomonas sp. TaxID=306 RepID=UPI000C95D0AD|nr:two-component system response regulator [Pseudomonadales bacterium]